MHEPLAKLAAFKHHNMFQRKSEQESLKRGKLRQARHPRITISWDVSAARSTTDVDSKGIAVRFVLDPHSLLARAL
jgi:hypothetical protein